MSIEILQDENYKKFSSNQVKELITYLKENNYEFNITAQIRAVTFSPILPENIKKTFGQYTLFAISNYAFSSLVINKNNIEFETGFGAQNFGSVSTIPYYSIFQIGIKDSIIFINPIATIDKYFSNKQDNKEQEERSKNAFKNFKLT